MLVDFEGFIFDFLVNPSAGDVCNVLSKYKISGQSPIFEQRANTCLEVRQLEVERNHGNASRLPARFEFDTSDHARVFIELLTLHWERIQDVVKAA